MGRERSLRGFDEQFLAQLEYLYVVAKKVFIGRMRADRRSRRTGAGVEFADHRDYTAGDDLRYLDWAAYGRLGRLLIRLFQEEEDLHLYLLLDTSASMASAGKLDHAARICAALAYVGLAKLDRVSIVPFGAAAPRALEPVRGKGNVLGVLDYLGAIEPAGPTELGRALETFARQTRRRGLAIVVSDFYDPDGYQSGLNALRYHRFEPTVIQLWDAAEARPSLRGDVELVDVETGDRREVTISERVLDRYAQAHAAFCAGLEAFCTARGIAYFRADTAVPFEELLLRIFRAGGFLA